MQNSSDLNQVQKQLKATQSDYSLIVNTADQKLAKSFEFSSTLGMNTVFPEKNEIFASTNYYLSKDWKNIPEPTDATTWTGVTRRNNLLNLVSQSDQIDISSFEKIMDKNMAQGGAAWNFTIYQLIFDSSDLSLYAKINNQGNVWNKIPLKELFASTQP